MNESPHQDADDRELEHLLAPLRRIEPPGETREGVRQTLLAVLPTVPHQPEPKVWWRRTVSVPVPFAAAAVGIMVALAGQVLLARSSARPTTPVVVDQIPVSRPPVEQPGSAMPRAEYFQSEVFICGVGRLGSHAEFRFRRNNDE